MKSSILRSTVAACAGAFLAISCSLALASSTKSTAAPAKAAPAAKPAASSAHPAGAAGAAHGTGAAGASHPGGLSANGHSGPSANGHTGPSANATHGPSANRTDAGRPTTGGSGNVHPPTTAAHPAIDRPLPRGAAEHASAGGSAVRTRPNGRVSDVHDARRGMDVHHNLNGNRRVSVERADHSRFVSERGRPGFVERGYRFHDHDFGRRHYFYHGREYDRFYRGYYYRGVYLNVYAPAYYYGPGFYGWAYNPWAVAIAYGWGWGASPWYGYYGGYFAPYPVYPNAAFWLTDYIIAQDLQAAYAAHQEAGEVDGAPIAAGAPAELTPDVKQQIADEVKAQLALENLEATKAAQHQDADPSVTGIERLMRDGHPHVFVAGDALDVVDASGQECGLSDGDAVLLQSAPPGDATTATVVVLASKGGQECKKSSNVTVQLADLQEMQNHMRATVDQGLQELQEKQGTGGLPTAPPSAQAKPVQAEYAQNAPPPDPKDAADLQAQAVQADQAEKEVTTEVAKESGTASPAAVDPVPAAQAPPVSVELGQTEAQVTAGLGQPARIAKLGAKEIYYYNGMKVTFNNGKVSDVQ